MFNALLIVHIGAAAIACISMFVPAVARKGGSIHRRAGWVYVSSMTTAAVTALLLCVRLVTHAELALRMKGYFLIYVAVLVLAGVFAGVRVLRAKQRTKSHRNPWDLGAAATLVSAGLTMAAYGLSVQQPLFVALSLIGLYNGTSQLLYWLRPPSHTMHWWFEHMEIMLGSCVGTLTAFFVFVSPYLGASQTMLAIWVAPLVLSLPGIYFWRRHYRRLFGTATAARAARATAVGAAAER
jgi:uncharacterized membrane protein